MVVQPSHILPHQAADSLEQLCRPGPLAKTQSPAPLLSQTVYLVLEPPTEGRVQLHGTQVSSRPGRPVFLQSVLYSSFLRTFSQGRAFNFTARAGGSVATAQPCPRRKLEL